MSHFTVLVVGENVEQQLAPFQENNMGDCPPEYLKYRAYPKDGGDAQWFDSEEQAREALGEQYDEDEAWWENPNRKWDWYLIGGRWTGFFKLKPGASGEIGEPGVLTEAAQPGLADSCLLCDIDFEGPRTSVAVEAAATYDAYTAIIEEHGQPESFNTFSARWPELAEARQHYWAQPAIKALQAAKLMPWGGSLEALYAGGKDAYVERAVRTIGVPFAVLKDGVWHERAPWGGDEETDAANEAEWCGEFHALLAGLSPQTRLTAVDCHI